MDGNDKGPPPVGPKGDKAMRPQQSVEQLAAVIRAKAKAAAGKTTKSANMWKRLDYLTRFHAERARLQGHFCSIFGFWKTCRLKPCRRARACRGDPESCQKRSLDGVPHDQLRKAQAELLQATPRHIGTAERRQFGIGAELDRRHRR
jgi:hypothetical protein